ncbi:MAG: DUF4347 domain-containing protein, partial [Planctomycetales bacterium]|nr:DUF4347 domain-containing protein [Planctomycetales bacterium]
MLRKLKERLSGTTAWKRQEKIRRRRTIQFEMMERRILPSADIPVAIHALQLNIDPQQLSAVSVAYDVQVMQAARDALVNMDAASPGVEPSTDQELTQQEIIGLSSIQPDHKILIQQAGTMAVADDLPASFVVMTPEEKVRTQVSPVESDKTEEPAAFTAANEADDSAGPAPENVSATVTDLQVNAARQIYLAQQNVNKVVFVDAGVTDYSKLIKDIRQTDTGTGTTGGCGLYAITKTAEASGDAGADAFVLIPASSLTGNTGDGTDDVSADDFSNNDDSSIVVIILNQDYDGIDQMSQILNQCRGLSEVHIISHGAAGLLTLGNSSVYRDELKNRMSEISAWKESLTPDADVFLYGCNVAAGEVGVEFVETLAVLTGADVAASTNNTGNANLGGDWILEYSTGLIEAEAFDNSVIDNYEFLLENINVNGTAGADTMVLDMGTLLITGGTSFVNGDLITIDGLAGTDSLTIMGSSGDETITLSGSTITIGSTTINFSNFESIVIDGNGGTDSIVISGNTILFGMNLTLGGESITVNSGVTVNTGAGNIAFTATDSKSSSTASSAASVYISGAILIGGDIRIAATSTVTGSSSLPVAVVDVDSSATIAVVDSQITSSGKVTISASSNLTASATSTGIPGSLVGADAAAATVIADSTAIARISGTSAVSAVGALSLTAENSVIVTASADASVAGAGAALGLAVVNEATEAFINSTGTISAGDMDISATGSETITTKALASAGGADTSGGATTSQSKLGEYKAETSNGSIGVAAAVAITDLKRQTKAYISTPATITSADGIDIIAISSGGAATLADGGNAKSAAGVGVAINLVDADNKAYVDGNSNLAAKSISVQALMPSVGVFSAEAISGAGAVVGVAGSLAINIVDNISTAIINSGSTATLSGGNGNLAAENMTVSKAIARPVNGGATAGSVGVGASVALNIANTTTVAELA